MNISPSDLAQDLEAEFAHGNGDRAAWVRLSRTYRCCLRIAQRAFQEHDVPCEPTALVAATATLFIEANKRGLTAPEPAGAA